MSRLHWDPTGQLLASCAVDNTEIKCWSPGSDQWISRHHMSYHSAVTIIEWCHLPGTRESQRLMLAKYVTDKLYILCFMRLPT